jgi:crotonobetainyl-CoA:carnitine CoA-transferase CaiB-like acyl-CoA transferase
VAPQSRHVLFELLSRNRIPAAFVPDASELPGLVPHRERAWFTVAADGPLAGHPLPGPPIRLHGSTWTNVPEAPVTVEAALVALHPRGRGSSMAAPRDPHRPDSDPLPLAGLNVIEIAQGWAGPLVGAILADYGATVIKVESVSHPDWWRGGPRQPGDRNAFPHERAWYFNGVNRNKLGVTLELQSAEGRDLLLRLLRDADVFVENFTAGVMSRLGLEYQDVSAGNPGLVMVSLPGYGLTGSWRGYPALGTTIESMCGIQSVAGYADSGPRINSITWDPVVGLHAVVGALAALRQRDRTGNGQLVEVSHIEAGTQLFAEHYVRYLATGIAPRPCGNSADDFAPHGCYPTRGEDEWIAIAVDGDDGWQHLCRVLDPGGNVVDTKEFATPTSRLAAARALDAAITELTVSHDRMELFHRLQERRVPCAPVMRPSDLLGDDHLHARGFFVTIDRAYVGEHPYPGLLFPLAAAGAREWRPAPTLGEHNREVLVGQLGLADDAYQGLIARGIIGTVPHFASVDELAAERTRRGGDA